MPVALYATVVPGALRYGYAGRYSHTRWGGKRRFESGLLEGSGQEVRHPSSDTKVSVVRVHHLRKRVS